MRILEPGGFGEVVLVGFVGDGIVICPLLPVLTHALLRTESSSDPPYCSFDIKVAPLNLEASWLSLAPNPFRLSPPGLRYDPIPTGDRFECSLPPLPCPSPTRFYYG